QFTLLYQCQPDRGPSGNDRCTALCNAGSSRGSGMHSEPLPPAATPGYLTQALRRGGALGDGVVGAVAVDTDRDTIVSRILRLRLSYDGADDAAPRSLILKTGLPARAGSKWIAGRQEVAFYTNVAPATPRAPVPRCFDAHWRRLPTNGICCSKTCQKPMSRSAIGRCRRVSSSAGPLSRGGRGFTPAGGTMPGSGSRSAPGSNAARSADSD